MLSQVGFAKGMALLAEDLIFFIGFSIACSAFLVVLPVALMGLFNFIYKP
jgi:hypothetical protein